MPKRQEDQAKPSHEPTPTNAFTGAEDRESNGHKKVDDQTTQDEPGGWLHILIIIKKQK